MEPQDKSTTPPHMKIDPALRAASLVTPRQEIPRLSALLKTFSPSERLLLYILTIVLSMSAFVLLANVNNALSTEVPTQGGALIEGSVGTPRFINPLLALSQPDQDLTMLVYSGLLRPSFNGEKAEDG